MDIPEDTIASAARDYLVFAFDEGTAEEIRAARVSFNETVNDAYLALTRSALMRGFYRPTSSEFRENFITACRAHLRRSGLI